MTNQASLSQEPNEESDTDKQQYYLIRVPKSIDLAELQGLQIDLSMSHLNPIAAHSSSSDNTTYGYDFVGADRCAFHHLTKLQRSENATGEDDSSKLEIDRNFALAGFINLYRSQASMPTIGLQPLVPESPNDPIEDIIHLRQRNPRRGSAKKRSKSTDTDGGDDGGASSSSKRRKKHHQV